jgi:hypothetical protein
MNVKKRLFVVAIGLSLIVLSVLAAPVGRNFRTTAFFIGVTQGTNQLTGYPAFDSADLAGWNIVNLAMGRTATGPIDTNQFLAFRIFCDTNPVTANLVVVDQSPFFYSTNFIYTTNSAGTITTNTHVTAFPFYHVVQVISVGTNFTSYEQRDAERSSLNQARFVVEFPINACGDATNGLAGGFLTAAGHLHLFLTNGCPDMVLVSLDKDPLDRLMGNKEINNRIDPDLEKLSFRTGLAHVIGLLDVVNDGVTNRILIPHGNLSIRRKF